MFMANLLDTAFQNFSSELASFHTDRDPIRRARSSLRGKMSDDIKRIMRDIDYDVMPNLPLPPRLTEQDRNTGEERRAKQRIIVKKTRSPTRNDKTSLAGGRKTHLH
jgi:hypothetical protein